MIIFWNLNCQSLDNRKIYGYTFNRKFYGVEKLPKKGGYT